MKLHNCLLVYALVNNATASSEVPTKIINCDFEWKGVSYDGKLGFKQNFSALVLYDEKTFPEGIEVSLKGARLDKELGNFKGQSFVTKIMHSRVVLVDNESGAVVKLHRSCGGGISIYRLLAAAIEEANPFDHGAEFDGDSIISSSSEEEKVHPENPKRYHTRYMNLLNQVSSPHQEVEQAKTKKLEDFVFSHSTHDSTPYIDLNSDDKDKVVSEEKVLGLAKATFPDSEVELFNLENRKSLIKNLLRVPYSRPTNPFYVGINIYQKGITVEDLLHSQERDSKWLKEENESYRTFTTTIQTFIGNILKTSEGEGQEDIVNITKSKLAKKNYGGNDDLFQDLYTPEGDAISGAKLVQLGVEAFKKLTLELQDHYKIIGAIFPLGKSRCASIVSSKIDLSGVTETQWEENKESFKNLIALMYESIYLNAMKIGSVDIILGSVLENAKSEQYFYMLEVLSNVHVRFGKNYFLLTVKALLPLTLVDVQIGQSNRNLVNAIHNLTALGNKRFKFFIAPTTADEAPELTTTLPKEYEADLDSWYKTSDASSAIPFDQIELPLSQYFINMNL